MAEETAVTQTVQQQVDLTKMSLTELKALAWDQLALVEQHQANVRMINQEIGKRK